MELKVRNVIISNILSYYSHVPVILLLDESVRLHHAKFP